ncbi:3-isopropylmalate dehydrogenase [Sporosarcina pasteurii]|uniref:3-isopropylmalate dehydrogenase n=1 Tax=Sporosarcina pasteurii TaxID=1474 RepID=A0A380BE14_SPOPA|nr:3-isopropylmalate dehydrogenase [Sporosarcina pasteurii]MDS9472389.1 3-isopropylmalate dehydrogenase [Sporosarcina pasteurii]QBQ06366.1 3-isopropylmalate dehydrogenase [Sporosarcina pasteurii]SUI98891.1 3-isopropylmalate dehydrogenase [Sporosarcina pasteurii]
MRKRIAVLPGDGIGPEVTEAAVKVLQVIGRRFKHTFDVEYGSIGGEAIDKYKTPLPDETIELCQQSDAILLGAVGGPKWDKNPAELRPEKGLLAIRKHFDLFANLRPVIAVPSLLKASPLKEEVVKDVDLMIVRELTGGLYFGEPSKRTEKAAFDTLVYTKKEIERIVEKAFELARLRKGKVTSVDKENVLQSSKLWREVVEEKKKGYPDVEVEHMLVDSAAMQLVTNPCAFDVVVTENMFGDILSDEASVITGSLGVLPSASIRADGFGMYEPIHGTAPDIAGQGKANPAATILSVAMMLKYSFGLEEECAAIEEAVNAVFEDGFYTADLASPADRVLSTNEWTDKVVDELDLQSVCNDIMHAYI